MTVVNALRQLATSLHQLYDKREAENIADIIIEKISGLKRIDRILNNDLQLSPEQEKILANYTTALLQYTPLQYVLQEAWFYGLPFFVNEHVLIPRPETEELVEWIITDIKTLLKPDAAIVDIGTGSGCIPVALKKNIPDACLTAIDISQQALHVAKKNADNNNVSIDFLLADMLNEDNISKLPMFDIIVSNPPYIPVADMMEMQENVLNFEPHLALFVSNDDPLIFYKTIAKFAALHLNEYGSIYVEIHEAMSVNIEKVFAENGFTNCISRKDMQGKDRMIKASR